MLVIPSDAARSTDALLKAEKIGVQLATALKINSRMFSIHNLLVIATLLEEVNNKKDPLLSTNFLEIGTFDGVNARLVAEIDPSINVFTYDVKIEDSRTEATGNIDSLNEHYNKRLKNTYHPRINYIEKSSSWIILNKNIIQVPDVILIDGDHSYPQVSFDLMTAVSFLDENKNCIIIIDDVLRGNCIFESTELLAKDLGLNLIYFEKRKDANPMQYVGLLSKYVPHFLIPKAINL